MSSSYQSLIGSRSRERPSDDDVYYLSVDFETIDDDWVAAGFVLMHYPTYTIVKSLEIGHNESLLNMQPPMSVNKFWSANPEALKYVTTLGANTSKQEAELAIVRFINDVKYDFPKFFSIGDNIAFDIRLLDNILIRHHSSVLSNRQNGVYLQTICAWSYKLSIIQAGFVTSRQIANEIENDSNNNNSNLIATIKHTPLFDATNTLYAFLALKNLVTRKRRKHAIKDRGMFQSPQPSSNQHHNHHVMRRFRRRSTLDDTTD